jgi:uncharacterized protein (TIGR01777 family)
MQIVIAGGTGLIGRALVEHWLKQGHAISVIGRSDKKIHSVFADRVKAIAWSKLTSENLVGCDLLVNLTGESVSAKKWDEKEKQEILASRTGSTKKLASLLCELNQPLPRWFNASGVGIYGTQPQNATGELPPALDETAAVDWEHPRDFLSTVATRWEKAADPAVQHGVPVTFLRFGAVLTMQGGALPVIIKPFKFYLGGPAGTGRQPFSWVSLDDVVHAIDFLVETPSLTGPVNIVSPIGVTQKVFAKTLGSVMRRPAFLPMPAFLLKALLGQMAQELILEGQNAYPNVFLDAGFKFQYGDLESALNHHLR